MVVSNSNEERDNLDGVEIEVVDGRELALLVRVTKDGDARVQAKGISKKEAARWLRAIAKRWEQQDD